MAGIVNKTHTVDADLVVTAGAYSDGDVVGGLTDFTALCGGGGGGVIRQILIADDDAESAIFKLYLFDGKPTVIADNAAFAAAMTIDDLSKLVAIQDITSYVTLNVNTFSLATALDFAHGTGQLWGYLVVNDATPPTYTATDSLILKITGWVD